MPSSKTVLLKVAVCVLGLLAVAPLAHAVPTMYTITNGQLFDCCSMNMSGTVSGSFTYDPDPMSPTSDEFSGSAAFTTTVGFAPFASQGTVYTTSECAPKLNAMNKPDSIGCTDTQGVATMRTLSLSWAGVTNQFFVSEASGPGENIGSRQGTVNAVPVVVPPVGVVPEPGSVALMVTGLAGLFWRFRRRS